MIDEEVLAQRVRDEIHAVAVPEHGARDIVALLADHGTERRRQHRRVALVAAIAASVVAVAWVIGPARGSLFSKQDSAVSSRAVVGDTLDNASATTAAGSLRTTSNLVVDDASRNDFFFGDGTVGQADNRSSAGTGSQAPQTQGGSITDQAKVVYSGSVDLEVARGDLGRTVQRITAIATSVDGYVAKQHSDESAGAPSATITIRVPGAEFTRAVERIRALGTVLSAASSGVDVTADYTDMQARARSLEAGRTQLFTVMQSAKTTGEILAVLDRITQLQTQLEQVQGRIKLLDDQTAFAAITATIRDKTPPAPAEEAPKAGLTKAVEDAKDGFSRRVESIVAHSGSAFVLIATGVIALLILRLAWPRFRRAWL